MNSKKLLDAFNYVDDRYLAMAEKPQKKVLHLKKKAFTLIAAAICVSLLAVTAIAKLPSAFEYLKQIDPEDAPLYEAAEEANRDMVPQNVELPQLKEASLIVNEKFYNGETILLGLNAKAVEGEPAIGFEPDEVLMKQIQSMGIVTSGTLPPENYDEIPYPRYAKVMADSLRHELTPEQYRQVEKYLEQTGHCCIVFRRVFVGDHIHVNGTDLMPTYNMDSNFYMGRQDNNTPSGQAIRLDSLPENARNQKDVTVELNMNSGLDYYYLDTEGHAWIYYAHTNEETASIIVPNSEMQ